MTTAQLNKHTSFFLGLLFFVSVSGSVLAQTNPAEAPPSMETMQFSPNLTEQTATATPAELQIDMPEATAIGEPLVVPILLNTRGVGINGIQLEGIIQGDVKEVKIESVTELGVQVAQSSADETGFTLWLLPEEITGAVTSNAPVEIARLTFTPLTEGEVAVSFNADSTLVADAQSGENVLTMTPEASVSVLPTSAFQPPTDSTPEVTEPASLPSWYEIYFSGSFLPLLGVITAAVLGAAIYWWNRMRTQLTSPPTTASMTNLPPADMAASTPPVTTPPVNTPPPTTPPATATEPPQPPQRS